VRAALLAVALGDKEHCNAVDGGAGDDAHADADRGAGYRAATVVLRQRVARVGDDGCHGGRAAAGAVPEVAGSGEREVGVDDAHNGVHGAVRIVPELASGVDNAILKQIELIFGNVGQSNSRHPSVVLGSIVWLQALHCYVGYIDT